MHATALWEDWLGRLQAQPLGHRQLVCSTPTCNRRKATSSSPQPSALMWYRHHSHSFCRHRLLCPHSLLSTTEARSYGRIMAHPSMILCDHGETSHLFFCVANSKHHRHGASGQPFVLSLANARRLDQLLQNLPEQYWNGHAVQDTAV